MNKADALEELILGHIAKELKDEIVIGRQVSLAKTITQVINGHQKTITSYKSDLVKRIEEERDNIRGLSSKYAELRTAAFNHVLSIITKDQ